MKRSTLLKYGIQAASVLVLAGCFAGGDDPVLPTPPELSGGILPSDPLGSLPSTVTASPSSLLTYQFLVLQVDAARADRAEPIDLSSVTLPTSETTEPADV